MKVLKSWLQDHIEDALPNSEKIEEAMIMKSSEIEGVIEAQVGGKADTVFDIKTLPDRAHYMLSHRGVAYDLSAILGLVFKNPGTNLPELGSEISVKIETDKCNRYIAIPVRNIANGDSPLWIKERLEAIGARSISTIVDITNYAMFDTGQPLHAFDADKVIGSIIVRQAKEGEEIELLPERILINGEWQNKERKLKLTASDMVIADEEGLLAIAGVKGGQRAIVTNETKNIILESASFDPVSVRRTSTKHNIRNDSSKRFENEITAHLTSIGASVFLDLMKELSPECEIGKMSDCYSKLPEQWSVEVSQNKIVSRLNMDVSVDKVKEVFASLGILTKQDGDKYILTPPLERLDLMIEEDFIDEVGRIVGLDKVKSILPKGDSRHEFASDFILAEKIKDFFFERGFSEIATRSFVNKGDIEVAYPMASDKGFLRTSLAGGVKESLDRAMLNAPLLGLLAIKIFEIGSVFPEKGEKLELCFALNYTNKIKNKDKVIKAEIDKLVQEFGQFFEVNVKVEINNNVAVISDLDLMKVHLDISEIKLGPATRTIFKSFSNEPFIVRDIALFVPSDVSDSKVREILANSAKNSAADLLVKGPDLFDSFEKDGKKSYAFRMIFQANDRTLSDEEINIVMEKVYFDAKGKGWEVR